MIDTTYYGTLQEANCYFASRLHETAWSSADPADRPKALWAATQIIDTLNYKGYKATVFAQFASFPNNPGYGPPYKYPTRFTHYGPTIADIQAAEAEQVLEFPRGTDSLVPDAIRRACYEIAHSLLDGKDPEAELENLGITSQGYGSVRTSYNRSQLPIEHLINGVPNALAWRLIRPFLRDQDAIAISRVS